MAFTPGGGNSLKPAMLALSIDTVTGFAALSMPSVTLKLSCVVDSEKCPVVADGLAAGQFVGATELVELLDELAITDDDAELEAAVADEGLSPPPPPPPQAASKDKTKPSPIEAGSIERFMRIPPDFFYLYRADSGRRGSLVLNKV
ncbi:MAG: hypothetical protein QM639_04245 [Rhodocyclaceae bacterium]